LSVSHGNAAGDVETSRNLQVGVANLEGTVLGIVGHVVRTSHAVVDVLAVSGLVCAARSRITDCDTKGIATHEVRPVDNLLVGVVVATVAWERVGVHQTSERIPTKVSTMRVEFSSIVLSVHVNLSLVDKTSDLNVLRCDEILNTLKGTIGNETSAVTRLCAPCNLLLFSIADSGVGDGWCPLAEIVDVVHH